MTSKVCRTCGIDKPLTDYYMRPSKPIPGPDCRACAKAKFKVHYAENKDRYKEYRRRNAERNKIAQRSLTREYSLTIHGRAKILLKSAGKRSKSREWELGIDLDFVKRKLERGVCEVTGIGFDLNPHDKYKNNPLAPSLDRIDSDLPYTPENTRMVIWQYNCMKMNLTDDDMLTFCRLFVELCPK